MKKVSSSTSQKPVLHSASFHLAPNDWSQIGHQSGTNRAPIFISHGPWIDPNQSQNYVHWIVSREHFRISLSLNMFLHIFFSIRIYYFCTSLLLSYSHSYCCCYYYYYYCYYCYCYCYCYCYYYWLVVQPPLWKIWVRQLGWLETQYFWENMKFMATKPPTSSGFTVGTSTSNPSCPRPPRPGTARTAAAWSPAPTAHQCRCPRCFLKGRPERPEGDGIFMGFIYLGYQWWDIPILLFPTYGGFSWV